MALSRHADAVRRICFLHLNHRGDVEDVFQEVFLKHALHDVAFESEAHERAWLLRVAINACKDVTKGFWRRRVFPLEQADLIGLTIGQEESAVLGAVLRLTPPQYRDVIYLHYFEGYKATEIAVIFNRKENTIYTWLDRARKQLRTLLGGAWNDE